MERKNFTLAGIFENHVLACTHLLRYKSAYTNIFFEKHVKVVKEKHTSRARKRKWTCGIRKQPSQNKKNVRKGLFFSERLTSKMKILKPRKIWFMLQEGKKLLEKFWLRKRNPKKHLHCCTNSVCYSVRYVFCMLCIHCVLFLYLHFKFNKLRFKGITNHSYKCMVIIMPQSENNIFHMTVF